MACNCKKNKYHLEHIINMTKITVSMRKIDMQIYESIEHTGKIFYDYEPVESTRKKIVKYIKYKDFSHTDGLL